MHAVKRENDAPPNTEMSHVLHSGIDSETPKPKPSISDSLDSIPLSLRQFESGPVPRVAPEEDTATTSSVVVEPPAKRSFVTTSGTQTEISHDSISALQAQFNNFVETFAAFQAKNQCELEKIKDLLVRQKPTSSLIPAPTVEEGNDVPLYGLIEGGVVKMVVHDGSVPDVKIPKVNYDKIFYRSKTATSFTRQLLPIVFSKEELKSSNYEGGEVVTSTGVLDKNTLERSRITAILRQVELEYPGSTVGKSNMAKLREAINDRCRSETRRSAPHL